MKYIFNLLIFILLSCSTSFAGWKIIMKEKGSVGEKTEVILYQYNKMKSVGDMIIIYDMNVSEMSILNPATKVFWKGTTKDYKAGIVEMMKKRMDVEIQNVPEYQRPMVEKMYKESLDKFIEGTLDTTKTIIEIKKIGTKQNIANYATTKYELWVNNFKKMELWVSDKIDISKDFNYDVYSTFMKELMNSRKDLSYNYSKEFMDLVKKNFALKSFDVDSDTQREAVSATKENIPESEFAIPEDYKAIPLGELLEQTQQK